MIETPLLTALGAQMNPAIYHTSAYTAARTVRSMPRSMPQSHPGAAPGAALATQCDTPPASPRCSAGLPPSPAWLGLGLG
eukprot:scaffold31616_cov59-Phaeocystis_antarctica.AAC.2